MAEKMDALLFVDTNILLDFYRIRGGEGGLSLLRHIDASHERIITGDQVEMEYKKNRQRVILDSLSRLKVPDWTGLTPPAFLADAQPAKRIAKSKTEISKQHKRLKGRIESILENPSRSDPVYKVLQRLFRNRSPYNLTRAMDVRFELRELAEKRFKLGYPPRKDKDTSIGDAINWEWVIHCADKSGKDIIIVSRDSDYGSRYGREPILNDWLAKEFKERVSRKRSLILTDKLTRAFKLVAVRVTDNEVKQEEDLLADTRRLLDELERKEALRPPSDKDTSLVAFLRLWHGGREGPDESDES